MAAAYCAAGYWGLRAAVDLARGHSKRGSAREKAVTNRFDVREATTLDAEYHQGLVAVDKMLNDSQSPEAAMLRAVTVHYRLLGGIYRATGDSTLAFPIIAPTSHWGVQIGDLFYDLRQKRDYSGGIHNEAQLHGDDDAQGTGHHQHIDVQDEGDKVILAMTRNRIIVDGSKSIYIGKTSLGDSQIMGRASYIFKRLFAHNYNILIDNCQSFTIFLCESILDETERHIVRERLQSRSSLYSNVAGSAAVSVGYYLAAGLAKDADDMLTVVGDLSTEGGKKRVEAWKKGMHEAVDRRLDAWDKIYLHPEVFHARRTFYSTVLDKVGEGLHGLGDKLDAGAERLDRFAEQNKNPGV